MKKPKLVHVAVGGLCLAGAAGTGYLVLAGPDSSSEIKDTEPSAQPFKAEGENDTLKTNGKHETLDLKSQQINGTTSEETDSSSVSKSIDPLQGELPNEHKARYYYNFTTEIWGCTKRLFPNSSYSNIKHDRTEYSHFSYSSWLDWSRSALKPILNGRGSGIYHGNDLTSKQQNQTIGCAIAQIKPITGAKNLGHYSDYYFKSEIVVKNDRIGLILWTDWATAKNQYDGAMTHRMLLMVNRGYKTGKEEWSVGGGLWWNDYNATYPTTFSRDHYIRMPGENRPWYKSRDHSSVLNGTQTWSGIWIAGESGGKPVYQDFYVSSIGETKSEFLGAQGTPFLQCHLRMTCGWHYGGYYYETRENHAPGWWGFVGYHNIQAHLFSWYRPFLEVKGVWRKSNEACQGVNSTSNKALMKLCGASSSPVPK